MNGYEGLLVPSWTAVGSYEICPLPNWTLCRWGERNA